MNEKEEDMERVIEKAKLCVEKDYGGSKRKWFEAEPPYSYSDPRYKVKLFIYEGSPPKGYIIADYSLGIVKALGLFMKPLYTWTLQLGG